VWSQGSLRCRDLGVWLRRESEYLNILSEYLRRYLPSSTTIHPHAPPSVCTRISCNPSCAKVTAPQSIAGRILNASSSYSFFPFPFPSSSASTVYDSITLHDHASHFQPVQPLQVSHCSSFCHPTGTLWNRSGRGAASCSRCRCP
jgi:hypothetical protein